MKLVIKSSSWSKWVKDYKPEETENEYEIILNEKYIIKKRDISRMKDGEYVKEEQVDFSFEIVAINESSVKIHTFQKFIGNQQDYTIEVNKPIKLCTPTRDCGDIFIISLIK